MNTLAPPLPPSALHRMELELVGTCGAVIGVLLVALLLAWLFHDEPPVDD